MIGVILAAIAIAIAAAVFLRPRQPAASHPEIIKDDNYLRQGTNEMNRPLTGIMLSYLVNNFLIDGHQYENWRGLAPEELKHALAKAGIMKESDFDSFSQQLLAEEQVQESQGEFASPEIAQDASDSGNSSDAGNAD